MTAAPILILTGRFSHGMLGHASLCMADAFRGMGHTVHVLDCSGKSDWRVLWTAHPLFLFTFGPQLLRNEPVPGRTILETIRSPVITYVPDHPVYHLNILAAGHDNLIPVMFDQTHCGFFQRFLATRDSGGVHPVPVPRFFPHPGYESACANGDNGFSAREECVLFAGSLEDPVSIRNDWHKHMPAPLALFLDQLMEACLGHEHIRLDNILESTPAFAGPALFADIPRLMFLFSFLDRYVRNVRRVAALNALIRAGVPALIHVNRPDLLAGPGDSRTRVLPPISFEESLVAVRRVRVTLSILPTYHGGMTERVSSAMMNGSLLLSEAHDWLGAMFPDGREAVYFQGHTPEQLPVAWESLRTDIDRCARIAAAGERRVRREFTVRHLAEFVLALATGA